MSQIAISSFSLRDVLGPLHFKVRDESGNLQPREFPLPALHSLEEFGKLVKSRLGVATVELCQIQFGDSTPGRIAGLRSALDAAGVTVLTVPIDVGDLAGGPTEHLEEDLATITRWFDIAQTLGARFVRVNVGKPEGGRSWADRGDFLDAMRLLCHRAALRQLRLLVENLGGESSNPEFLLRLQNELGAENIGILLDLGNFEPIQSVAQARFSGEHPLDSALETDVVYQRIAAIAPFADLIHSKAYDPVSDGSHLLDLEKALSIVAEAGFTGDIAIEWEGLNGDPWERTAETLAMTRRFFPLHH